MAVGDQPSADQKLASQVMRHLDEIQRRATADWILSEIVRDLHGAPIGWSSLDVDDRNAITASWRKRIITKLEEYF